MSDALHAYFESMGFRAVARHRSKAVTLYRQGEVNFIVNAEPESHGARFAAAHGPSACAMAFRVKDAAKAYAKLIELGAKPFANQVGPMELNIPAIEGIGGSVIYLVDRYGDRSIYDVDFVPTDPGKGFAHEGAGLTYIDHVTHNVFRGNMDKWAGFYESFFNFREVRYFDIEGKLTGLKSRAMTSPDGKIRIPINESSDDKSQIAEYLDLYKGEGIQHIALGTGTIYDTVEKLRANGVDFQDTPDTYYERLDNRIKGHGEDVARLKARPHPDGWRAPPRTRACCCKSSPKTPSARSSSRSSSARAMKVSAKAISRRCSNPSNSIRSGAACFRTPRAMSTKDWIEFPRVEGETSKQAHADLPDGTYEREIGRDGFFGPATHLYHKHPPTGWIEFDGPLKPRAFDAQAARPRRRTIRSAPVPLLSNAHCRIAIWRCGGADAQPAAQCRRRHCCCSCMKARAICYCDFGHMTYREGDYLLLPRGTMWRHRAVAAHALARDRSDEFELQAAGAGHSGSARHLRSRGAGNAQARRRIPRPASIRANGWCM